MHTVVSYVITNKTVKVTIRDTQTVDHTLREKKEQKRQTRKRFIVELAHIEHQIKTSNYDRHLENAKHKSRNNIYSINIDSVDIYIY